MIAITIHGGLGARVVTCLGGLVYGWWHVWVWVLSWIVIAITCIFKIHIHSYYSWIHKLLFIVSHCPPKKHCMAGVWLWLWLWPTKPQIPANLTEHIFLCQQISRLWRYFPIPRIWTLILNIFRKIMEHFCIKDLTEI